MDPSPGKCPVTGASSPKKASRCPFAYTHGIVQTIAISFYAVFPAGRGSKELSIEAASEEFIRILLENREQIAPIAQYGMQSRLAECISSSQKDPVQFCFIDDEHLTKVMVTAFQNFVCDLENASKWKGFSKESLMACLKNYTGGIEIVVKIFLAIIESYKEQYKKYPEPAALKKMEGSMVNIAHAVGRGPKLYANILREYIRDGAAGMKNIFYFTEDGKILERAEIGKSIEDDFNETCGRVASHDAMPDAFYGKHCAGLAMIPKLAHMMNQILFELYNQIHSQ